MGNASQINRSRNSVRVERRSDLNESDLGEVYCTLLKVVSHYDFSGLSMSVMGFQKKVWMEVGGLSSIQFCFGFFNFAKPLTNTTETQCL